MKHWGVVVAVLAVAGVVAWMFGGQSHGSLRTARDGDVPPLVEAERPATGPVVVLHVVDSNGKPVSGATVGSASTDEKGVCEVPLTGEKQSVRVDAAGYCPAKIDLDDAASDSRERWVRLVRGRDLEAVVLVEGTEQPAEGARVELRLWMGPVDAESPRVAIADANGRVGWTGVPDGYVSLKIVPPAFYAFERYGFQLAAGRSRERIRLYARPTTHLVVEIVDQTGERVAGARVLTPHKSASWPRVDVVDGVFEADVPKGHWFGMEVWDVDWGYGVLELQGDGQPERRERVVVTPAKENPKSVPLRIHFIDRKSREGVSSVKVDLQFRSPLFGGGETSSREFQIPLLTDADGWLVIEAIPISGVTVYGSKDGYVGTNGIILRRKNGAVDGEVGIYERPVGRTIRGRLERPERFEVWYGSRRHEGDIDDKGNFELHGFARESERIDIHYRLDAEVAKDLVLKNVAIGSQDVVLPLYPTGNVAIQCRDASGNAVDRALIVIREREALGGVWKEDPRGNYVITKVPAGSYEAWAWRPGYAEVGPVACVVREGELTELAFRFGKPWATVSVRAIDVDGIPLDSPQVFVLKPSREEWVQLVGEHVADAMPWGSYSQRYTTMSDGRCDIPVPQGEVVIALQSVVYFGGGWGTWDSEVFGHREVTVPERGRVEVEIVLDWKVFVSKVEKNAPAAKAGFRRGDVIVSWGGKAVRDVSDCVASAEATRVSVRRKKEVIELMLPGGRHGAALDRLYFER